LNVKGTFDVTDSLGIGIAKPLTKLDVNGNALFHGKNLNDFNITTMAGVEFFFGRNAENTKDFGLHNADLAFNYGSVGAGFRHFISTRHDVQPNSTGNAFDFSVNNSTTSQGSQEPGIGNKIMFTISANGVGIDNPLPKAPLHFKNEYLNRKIVLFDPNNLISNDHQFYGFGVNEGVLKYQSVGSHIFYSAINNSSSREVFKISESGNVNFTGKLGIGTANIPIEKLYVNGDAKIETNLQVNGSSTVVGDANMTGNAYITNNLNVGGNVNIGTTYLVQEYTIPATAIRSVAISCPTGTKLISGGGGNPTFDGNTDDVKLNYNGPQPTNIFTTWLIHASNTGSSPRPLRIYCICARIN
jgi:hypothetical protein